MAAKIVIFVMVFTLFISSSFGGVVPALPAAYIAPYASSYTAHVVNHAVAAPVAAPLVAAAPAPFGYHALPHAYSAPLVLGK